MSGQPRCPTAGVSRRSLLAACSALAAPSLLRASPGRALPPELTAELPGARRAGNGRLRFLGLRVYDMHLWVDAAAPAGNLASAWASLPLALEIEYARSLQGGLIAERSLEEMRRQADPSPATAERWLAQMKALFPDVGAGDRLTGVQQSGTASRFFFNGTLKGEVRDAEFTRLFFGIWLSPRTSEPALREALLGGSGGRS
jgi:Chalcone isomerase-like